MSNSGAGRFARFESRPSPYVGEGPFLRFWHFSRGSLALAGSDPHTPGRRIRARSPLVWAVEYPACAMFWFPKGTVRGDAPAVSATTAGRP